MTPFGVIEGRTSWIQTISFLPPIIVFGSLMFDPVRGHRGKNIVDTNHFLSSSYHRLRVIDV
ncbi:MAG: hypothetical protein IPN36_09575 [Bacteroidetes bacterium]|nr:hypothetical protein [Bacteroidota bacterium]